MLAVIRIRGDIGVKKEVKDGVLEAERVKNFQKQQRKKSG